MSNLLSIPFSQISVHFFHACHAYRYNLPLSFHKLLVTLTVACRRGVGVGGGGGVVDGMGVIGSAEKKLCWLYFLALFSTD